MSKKVNNEVLLGGFIVVAGGLLAYMCVAVGGLNMTSGVHVKARFSNASGLVKDAVVSVAGVQVGHIEKLEVDHDQAVVTVFLNKSAGIRKDAEAIIRAKSLLGEKYLEIRPKSKDAAMMADGDQIAVTLPSVEVDEVLTALGPVIRKVSPDDIATIVTVAAKTLREEQGNIHGIIEHANSIAKQVDGYVTDNRGKLDSATANLASMAKNGKEILESNRGKIDATIANVDRISGQLDRKAPALLDKGQRIADNVAAISEDIKREAPTLVRDAKGTLKHANTALARVPGALDNLEHLSKGVDNTLHKVNPLLDKAAALTPQKMQEFAHDTLSHGIKIYIAPFGPSMQEMQKLPQEQPSPQAP